MAAGSFVQSFEALEAQTMSGLPSFHSPDQEETRRQQRGRAPGLVRNTLYIMLVIQGEQRHEVSDYWMRNCIGPQRIGRVRSKAEPPARSAAPSIWAEDDKLKESWLLPASSS